MKYALHVRLGPISTSAPRLGVQFQLNANSSGSKTNDGRRLETLNVSRIVEFAGVPMCPNCCGYYDGKLFKFMTVCFGRHLMDVRIEELAAMEVE